MTDDGDTPAPGRGMIVRDIFRPIDGAMLGISVVKFVKQIAREWRDHH